MNRAEQRAESRRIKKHQDHGKLIQPLDGTGDRWAEVFCAKCGVHIGFLDHDEWQNLQDYDREQIRQHEEMTRLHNYLYNPLSIVKDD